jgi:hypothetical protein
MKRTGISALASLALSGAASAQGFFMETFEYTAQSSYFSNLFLWTTVLGSGVVIPESATNRVLSLDGIMTAEVNRPSVTLFEQSYVTLKVRQIAPVGTTFVRFVGTVGSFIVNIPSNSNWTTLDSRNYGGLGRIRHVEIASDCDSQFDNILYEVLCQNNGYLTDVDNDGFLTGGDFDQYVTWFETGDLRADFDLDGFLTGIDYDCYVFAFEMGCP